MKRPWCRRLAVLLLILAPNSSLRAHGQSAREILEQTGVKGGLIVHIDCGDGRLTAALRDNERYVVHGLDADARDIETARGYIQSLGLYGPVSVQSWNGTDLPYADNLASLVVVGKSCFYERSHAHVATAWSSLCQVRRQMGRNHQALARRDRRVDALAAFGQW
ncbi:MAG: class I SAM-dependent methyltransferase [Planctomycetota bacterium]